MAKTLPPSKNFILIQDRLEKALIETLGPNRPFHRRVHILQRKGGEQVIKIMYDDQVDEAFTLDDAVKAAEYFEGGGKPRVSLHSYWDLQERQKTIEEGRAG